MTLSLASSNSLWVTMRLLRRAAISAASLTRFIRSAPEKPGVPRAMGLRLRSGARDRGVGDHARTGEAARTQQGRVENVGAVGGGDQDDAFIRFEPIHLAEQ